MRTAQPAGHGTVTTQPPGLPVWQLEFECHGQPYKWTGAAQSGGLAKAQALADLNDYHPAFNRYKAQLIACCEVAA